MTETTPQPEITPKDLVPSTPVKRNEERRVTIEQLAQLGPMASDDRRVAWVNALVDADVARQSYATDVALAKQFALCGQFDDIKGSSQEQEIATAMVKIQLGRAWGFNAADAMQHVFFTNGRPGTQNEIVAAKLKQAGYDWDIEWLENTEQHKGRPWKRCVGCTLWPKQWSAREQCYKPLLDRDGNEISVSFTEADADHAMIWEKGKQIPLSEKWNFKSWGRDMYYWRAISRFKKYHAPHVLRGAVLREEALEMIPADAAPPEQLPREMQREGNEVGNVWVTDLAGKKRRFRDELVAQGMPEVQESLLEKPAGEEPPAEK